MISAIITAIVSVLTDFGTGVATFLNDFIKELVFVTTTGSNGEVTTSLSAFASWSLAFVGLALVIGLGRLIVNKVHANR